MHRLWEPLADKQRPPNGYAAKFATPYCIAHAILKGSVGLDAFDDRAVGDPPSPPSPSKVRYQIDPANPYPRAFTGHIRARLSDGRIIEERQPHMRGGASEPLTRAEIESKFAGNARHRRLERHPHRLHIGNGAKALASPRIDLAELRG